MKWVTRARPKTDRIACPWLIRNFIDSEAEILYVDPKRVLEVAESESAYSFDAPEARYTHRDGKCTWVAACLSRHRASRAIGGLGPGFEDSSARVCLMAAIHEATH